jgi:hypothetical protein
MAEILALCKNFPPRAFSTTPAENFYNRVLKNLTFSLRPGILETLDIIMETHLI